MAGEAAPFSAVVSIPVAAAAAAADDAGNYVVAPFAGVLSAAEIIPAATLTGANTESRTVQVHNRGQAGAGTTLMASKAFVSGVNAPIEDATSLTLSATAADLVVAAGDVIEVTSLHVGATGLAGPEFLARLTFGRTGGS
jgi:hypothetical protein